jgi:drug/metabolite transporter (DMT)-like permease
MGFWISLFYIAVISTTFGTTVYLYASSKLGSSRASSFIFLVPATALFSSWLFLSEVPAWTTLAGGALAVAAVYTINKK